MDNNLRGIASFSENCVLLANVSLDGHLKIWDVESGVLKQEYIPSSHLSASATCLSWNGKVQQTEHRKRRSRAGAAGDSGGSPADLLALGTAAGGVLVYSVVRGDLVTELAGRHTGATLCVSWDAAGQAVFSGGADSHLFQHDLTSGKVTRKLRVGRSGGVHSVCPLPDGSTVLTACRTITWWDLTSQTALRTYTGHASECTVLRHVPGTPAGQGGYFVSGAAGERAVSCWQLGAAEAAGAAPAAASVSFRVSAPPQDVQVSSAAADGTVLVTVVTGTGQLHVFQQQLNGVKRKPVRPQMTVQVASEGSKARPIPVLCARPTQSTQNKQLIICHGSFLRPTFERLPFSTDEPEVCLVRAGPGPGPGPGVPSEAARQRLTTPRTDGHVTQLAPAQLTAGRKRRTSREADSDQQLPMQRRLELQASRAGAAGSAAVVPTASNLAQLLLQGLHGRDSGMLRTVLQNDDQEVIQNTVESLPPEAILQLVDRLGHTLRFSDQSVTGVKWLRAVIERHTSLLMARTDLDEVLAPVCSSLQVRTRHYPRLLQLKGRLELVMGQISARHKLTSTDPAITGTGALVGQQQALLTHTDDSTDDELDQLTAPPGSDDEDSDGDSDDDQAEGDEQLNRTSSQHQPMEQDDADLGNNVDEQSEESGEGEDEEEGSENAGDSDEDMVNGD